MEAEETFEGKDYESAGLLAMNVKEQGECGYGINDSLCKEASHSSAIPPVLCDCGRPAQEKIVGDQNINKGLRYLSCANYVPFYMKKKLKKKKLLEASGLSCSFFRWLDTPRATYEQKKQAKEERRLAKAQLFRSKEQQSPYVTRAAARKGGDTFQSQEAMLGNVGLSFPCQSKCEAAQYEVQDAKSHCESEKNHRTDEVAQESAIKDSKPATGDSVCVLSGECEVTTYSSCKQFTESSARDLTASSNFLTLNDIFTDPMSDYAVLKSASLNMSMIIASRARSVTICEGRAKPCNLASSLREGVVLVDQESQVCQIVGTLNEKTSTSSFKKDENRSFFNEVTEASSNICMKEDNDPPQSSPHTKKIDKMDVDRCEACNMKDHDDGSFFCERNVENHPPNKTDCGAALIASADDDEAPLCDCKKEAVLKRVQRKTVNHGRLFWVCTNSVHPFRKKKRKIGKVCCRFFRSTLTPLTSPKSPNYHLGTRSRRIVMRSCTRRHWSRESACMWSPFQRGAAIFFIV